MKKITFAINTTANEAEHFDLLLKSLYKNLSHREHEILVFVDNDKGKKVQAILNDWKGKFNDFSVIKNPLNIPVGYQRNVNILIEKAKYDIVSYLQSDMYICKDYDIKVLKHIKPGAIVSATRIEPPLHPSGPDKITKDFGLTPSDFKENEFTEFCESINKEDISTDWWAPFTLYKKNWLDIGGHDTAFRRACEDTDILNRLVLNGTKFIQSWSAYVYHFTCVASRGKNWFKKEGEAKRKLQLKAQGIEAARIVHKWGEFRHSALPTQRHKYKISAAITNSFANYAMLHSLAVYFDKIYVTDDDLRIHAINESEKLDEVDGKVFIPGSEMLLDKQEWKAKYKKYYRHIEYSDIFALYNPAVEKNDEVIIKFDLAKFDSPMYNTFIQKINDIIHYSTEEGDSYTTGIFEIIVNKKIDHVKENIIVNNPPLDFKLIKRKLK